MTFRVGVTWNVGEAMRSVREVAERPRIRGVGIAWSGRLSDAQRPAYSEPHQPPESQGEGQGNEQA